MACRFEQDPDNPAAKLVYQGTNYIGRYIYNKIHDAHYFHSEESRKPVYEILGSIEKFFDDFKPCDP